MVWLPPVDERVWGVYGYMNVGVWVSPAEVTEVSEQTVGLSERRRHGWKYRLDAWRRGRPSSGGDRATGDPAGGGSASWPVRGSAHDH